jgi:hypothetical protein
VTLTPVARRLEYRMTKDLVLGGVLLVVAAACYFVTSAIPDSQLADAVGARGLPRIYAILLAVLALLLVVSSWRRRRVDSAKATRDEQADRSLQSLVRAAGMLALGVIYLIALPWAGYVVSIAALIGGTAYYQGGRLTKQLLLVAAAGALLLWIVFVMLLRIPQPPGVWSAGR